MSNLRNGSTAEKRCNRMGWIGMLVTLGIVFGDIGTSPLYVMKAILHVGQRVDEPMILGALSCIIWTLTLQTTVKYVLVPCGRTTMAREAFWRSTPCCVATRESGSICWPLWEQVPCWPTASSRLPSP